MCLLAPFGCCGCSSSSSGRSSSPSPVKKEQKPDQQQEQQPKPYIQQQPAINSLNTINSFTPPQPSQQLNGDVPRSNFQAHSSLASLPVSMSLSLRDLPLPGIYSSNCSSWAAVEEFYDMAEYEERTTWWLHSASAGNINQQGLEI